MGLFSLCDFHSNLVSVLLCAKSIGWVGSITGMSSAQMAISEIGVSYPDDSFGEESRFGVPFTVQNSYSKMYIFTICIEIASLLIKTNYQYFAELKTIVSCHFLPVYSKGHPPVRLHSGRCHKQIGKRSQNL